MRYKSRRPDPLPNRYAGKGSGQTPIAVWSQPVQEFLGPVIGLEWRLRHCINNAGGKKLPAKFLQLDSCLAVGSAQKTVKPHLPYNQNKFPTTDTIVLTVQDQLAMGV